ncbi:MAG: hypothetical protein IID46_15600, partial [Planctomycetes bacterium]|nr:hypothetical protein [Planctomycetota bacterium]
RHTSSASVPHAASSHGGPIPDVESVRGIDLRVDGAHPVASPSPENSVDQRTHQTAAPATPLASGSSQSLSGNDFPPLKGLSPIRSSAKEDELLFQAGQIAEHLRTQLTELDRREQTLNEQLALLDQERRALRLWAQQLEDEMLERSKRLQAKESSFATKIADCEKLVCELEEQEQILINARNQLDIERAGLKEQIYQELDADRLKLHEAQQKLETERTRLSEQIKANQQEHERSLENLHSELDAERDRIREELIAELETDRYDLETQKLSWTTQRDEERSQIDRDRENNEEAFRRAEQEINSLRGTKEEELEREKQEHDENLQREREELRQEIEQKQAELKQERVILENRVRFQQDHLHKMRQEVEAAQKELRFDQQHKQAELTEHETLQRLRATQLHHYRILLEERENSIQREHELVIQSRQSIETETTTCRERFRNEREAWDQERQTQRAENRRQQDMLTLHAENLEARRERLDLLRTELEETHRHTLELRMSVEEALAQLAQATDDESARIRVDEAREALSEHYRHLREAVSQQHRELTEALLLLQREKEEFQEESQNRSEMQNQRDEKLHQWEEQLAREAESIDTKQASWRATRDSWMQEKTEAEHVIRGLLQQLTDLTGVDSDSAMSS